MLKMANGSRYYTALESVSIASVLFSPQVEQSTMKA